MRPSTNEKEEQTPISIDLSESFPPPFFSSSNAATFGNLHHRPSSHKTQTSQASQYKPVPISDSPATLSSRPPKHHATNLGPLTIHQNPPISDPLASIFAKPELRTHPPRNPSRNSQLSYLPSPSSSISETQPLLSSSANLEQPCLRRTEQPSHHSATSMRHLRQTLRPLLSFSGLHRKARQKKKKMKKKNNRRTASIKIQPRSKFSLLFPSTTQSSNSTTGLLQPSLHIAATISVTTSMNPTQLLPFATQQPISNLSRIQSPFREIQTREPRSELMRPSLHCHLQFLSCPTFSILHCHLGPLRSLSLCHSLSFFKLHQKPNVKC